MCREDQGQFAIPTQWCAVWAWLWYSSPGRIKIISLATLDSLYLEIFQHPWWPHSNRTVGSEQLLTLKTDFIHALHKPLIVVHKDGFSPLIGWYGQLLGHCHYVLVVGSSAITLDSISKRDWSLLMSSYKGKGNNSSEERVNKKYHYDL